jgi:hypothetical protein
MGIPATSARTAYRPGTPVEVRSRFRRDWVRGFEVASAEDHGYRLRRSSDNTLLPIVFDDEDVRLTGSGRARRAPVNPRFRLR